VALAWLAAAGLPWDDDLPPVRAARQDEATAIDRLAVLRHQLATGLNSPPTSSMGRLFDAAAALAGVRQTVTYEAQAAIEFEAAADPNETTAYEFHYQQFGGAPSASYGNGHARTAIAPSQGHSGSPGGALFQSTPIDYAKTIDGVSALLIDPTPLFAALMVDQRARLPLGRLAARFHNGVAHMTRDVCRRLRADRGLNDVVLGGGVWQNVTLLRRALALLRADGFTVYTHRLVPPNDGGLALGQAAVASIEYSVSSKQ
jgi:hydrogenase maturation protein HypF